MTNLKPQSYATFDLIRSEHIKRATFFVIIRAEDGIYSTGVLIDNPENRESGWYIFGEERFKTESAAMVEFNRLCASIPVKVHG